MATEGGGGPRRVPVIGLTGYLGAGKTTLLNRLLLRPGGRVGVIVNDFGAVNVDAGLITGQVDEVASIAGGCICCLEDAGGLDAALERLTHPRLGLDAVIVEASGIAEPGALARMIRFSGVEAVRPGGLVEVVDAVNYFETVDGGGTPPARFAAASLVVINKCDLLDIGERSAVLDRIEARAREANPAALVVRTSGGRIDPALVFDVSRAEDPEDELPIAALLREQYDSRHGEHSHAASVSVESAGPVDPEALVDLLEEPPDRVYRIKGAISVDAGRSRRGYAVHRVGRHVHVLRTREVPAASQLVAIGVELDLQPTRERLRRALAPSGRSSLRSLQRLERARRLSE